MIALGEDVPAKYAAEAAATSKSRTIGGGRVPGLHMTYAPDDDGLDHTKVTAQPAFFYRDENLRTAEFHNYWTLSSKLLTGLLLPGWWCRWR